MARILDKADWDGLDGSEVVDYLRPGKLINCFPELFAESHELHKRFRGIGCRGFSYQMDSEMKHYNHQHCPSYRLRSVINLRIALLAGCDLFYPPRVNHYLRGVLLTPTHYIQDGMPAVAFSLGMKTEAGWFVFVMQSDIASQGPSYVRDYFRGWRKVLFANVAGYAHSKTSALYLCRSEDVARACYPGSRRRKQISDTWQSIYDGTAQQFGMPLVRLPMPVNIQLYRSKPPIWTEYFYELSFENKASSLGIQKEVPRCPAAR